jgi:apolipoprotein N-acyltransferase
MHPDTHTVLDYASTASAKRRRLWVPPVFLSLAFTVWYWPRLTPTFFPNGFDWKVLALLAPSALAMARYSSLPGWAFVAYGAVAVFLFLCANFHDNNFRANTDAHDILLPWSAMVVGGALASRVIASIGRTAAR